MPFIQNVSWVDAKRGAHQYEPGNTILIQIAEISFPEPKHTFLETYQFNFSDVDTDDHEDAPTDEHASRLVEILDGALAAGRNVVVHCVAGLCRSGAVAEIGVIMGFEDTGAIRSPNVLVKNKMLAILRKREGGEY